MFHLYDTLLLLMYTYVELRLSWVLKIAFTCL